MTKDEWAEFLQTLDSAVAVAEQTNVGLLEHINMACRVPPQKLVLRDMTTCDRGVAGCTIAHHDLDALVFAKLAFERIIQLASGDDPMPEL